MSYKLGYEKDINKFFDKMLKNGMFSNDLPPIFSSEDLYLKYINKIKDGKLDLDSESRLNSVSYFKTQVDNDHRLMEIPNPIGYIYANKSIYENWDVIYKYLSTVNSGFNKNKIKMDLFDDNYIFQIKAYDRNCLIKSDDRDKIGSKYLVKTDISKFYNSIYTHAFEWVFKENFEDELLQKVGLNIDKNIRLQRSSRTNGICIGPSISYILGDIILFNVDKKLSKYNYHRYIDDFYCYCNTYEEAESFINDLKNNLSNHGLLLNISKTKIIKLNDLSVDSFTDYINNFYFPDYISSSNRDLLNSFFNGLSRYYKDGGKVYKYAFNKFISEYYTKDLSLDVCKYLNIKYLGYITQYPYLISLVLKLFEYYESNSIHEAKDHLLELLSSKLNIILKDSLRNNHIDVTCWIFYYAISYGLNLYIKDLRVDIETVNNPLIYTLLYYYIKESDYEVLEKDDFATYCSMNKDKYENSWWIFYYEMNKERIYTDINSKYASQYNKMRKENISFIKY